MLESISPQKLSSAQWKKFLDTNSLGAPFFSRGWHELWFKIFGQGWQPLMLIIDQTVLAPLARRNDLVIFSGGREIADYLDLIGPNELKAAAWQEIVDYCRSQDITRFELFNVPQSSATLPFFKNYPKTQIIQEDTTPKITLPTSWEEYLAILDSHARHELRRKMRGFENENPNLSFVLSKNPQPDIKDLLELMRLNFDKKKFLTERREIFFRKLPGAFPNELLLFFLKLADKPIASMLAFRQDQVLLTYNSGYDQANFSGAGFYLKAMSIRWAIEQRFKEYNFLQGSERYKYDLGGKDFFVYTITTII